ncbi:DUF6492 family protein [Leptolyngbya sp. FACHB-711]|uniref:DUF6492 family protein n=1 Tax=Leptolyngbya sp. FACHB-711 TaxID=2692813 RepID=UPI001683FC94|nr:DUF6492 family protein [Leptolyngbya sp. FACHB-711]MBD2028358.1 hypothetical protein [Leptolyngbya sp. FACHB-711]
MDYSIVRTLTDSRLPFQARRVNWIRKYLYHKKWQQNLLSKAPIEIVIPCIERDLETLPFVVENVRKYLNHPIQDVYIVAPKTQKLLSFCQKFNCIFIDEESVLPIRLTDIGSYIFEEKDRRGWIFQQLLKLGADSFTKTQYYFVLDADTVLVSPQSMLINNQTVLNISNEFHLPYRAAYERLLGEKPTAPVSFVSHQMLFSKEKLAALKRKIQQHTKMIWHEAIISRIDRSENSSFSEYETYGNFLFKYYSRDLTLEYFFNLSLHRESLLDFAKIEKQYSNIYKSLSFHWYTSSMY